MMFYSDLFIVFCTLCLFIVITKGYKDLSFFLSIDCLSFNRQYVSCTCFTGKHPSTSFKTILSGYQVCTIPFNPSVKVIAPVVGASLVVWLPIQYILLIEAIGAVAACLNLLCVQIPSLQKTRSSSRFQKRTDGMLAYLAAIHGILPLFVCFTLVTFVLMPVFTLFPFMTLLHFNEYLQMGSCGNGLGLRGIVGRFSTCL